MLSCMKTATGEVTVIVDDQGEYEAQVRATIEHDPDYGSDADGNRGTPRDFLAELEILKVTDEDGEEIEPWDELGQKILEKADANWGRWQEDEHDPY